MHQILLSLTLALSLGTNGLLGADINVSPKVEPYTLVKASTRAEGTGYAWFVMGQQGFADFQVYDGGKGVVFTGPPGRYAIMLVVSSSGGMLDQAQAIVIIGEVTPTPIPPGPTPPPVPPPTPPPPPEPPAPIAADGFRVLIIHEDKSNLGEPQEAIFSSPEIYTYVTTHAAKEPNGQASWRVWDDDYTDVQLANVPVYFKTAYQAAVKAKKPDEPWIIVSNGKTGESVPLPKSTSDTLTLLKKYGGQ